MTELFSSEDGLLESCLDSFEPLSEPLSGLTSGDDELESNLISKFIFSEPLLLDDVILYLPFSLKV